MAKDKKNATVDTTVSTTDTTPTEPQEVPRGDRGMVGEATPSRRVKQLWHDHCHVLMNIGNKQNPRKQKYVRKQGADSLKVFARKLLAQGDKTMKDWMDCKNGALNESRSEKNVQRIAVEKTATRAAHRKNSNKAPKAAAATATK